MWGRAWEWKGSEGEWRGREDSGVEGSGVRGRARHDRSGEGSVWEVN